MTPAPSLQEVIQQAERDAPDAAPLSRLRSASALAGDMAEVGDAALGYFVDQARRAGHSWSEIGEALGVSKQAAQQRHTLRLSLGPNPPTLERFTARAKSSVRASDEAARSLGHDYIGTEHLLLGLYREPEGIAARILAGVGLTADQARQSVLERVAPGSGSPDGRLPHTPNAIGVFSAALTAALEMGHNYIGTEHLLMGLAMSQGVGREVLQARELDQGLVRDRVREELATLTKAPVTPPSSPSAPKKPGGPTSG